MSKIRVLMTLLGFLTAMGCDKNLSRTPPPKAVKPTTWQELATPVLSSPTWEEKIVTVEETLYTPLSFEDSRAVKEYRSQPNISAQETFLENAFLTLEDLDDLALIPDLPATQLEIIERKRHGGETMFVGYNPEEEDKGETLFTEDIHPDGELSPDNTIAPSPRVTFADESSPEKDKKSTEDIITGEAHDFLVGEFPPASARVPKRKGKSFSWESSSDEENEDKSKEPPAKAEEPQVVSAAPKSNPPAAPPILPGRPN
ncbi:MAG: hypothetical protein LBL16_00230 [Endomicrobium sp.]|jgi:hypothetical protein|nr:hypothetical protein [Endomicrobium sp.]